MAEEYIPSPIWKSWQRGKAFVEDMTKTITLFTSPSSLQAVALTMSMILPTFLLQKPSKKSKCKDHTDVS